MRALIFLASAFALGLGVLAAPEAQAARFNPSQLEAPSLLEDVRCITRHVRTVTPSGRVVYRTVQDCGHVRPRPYRPRCHWVQERTRDRHGRIVVRNVQRCGPPPRRW